MIKADTYKNKHFFEQWKESGAKIEDISQHNANLIREFIFDMENGTNVNVSNKKGCRSYIRLNAYKSKLKVIIRASETYFDKINIEKLSKANFNLLCRYLREGKIKRNDGKIYTDVADYIKSFKAFWHWLQRIMPNLTDITIEADVKKSKPKWVYLEEAQFKRLAESCLPYYKALCYFLLDTGMRAGEFANTRVRDIEQTKEEVLLNIRDEISKTYGRKIKLMFSYPLIKEHIAENKLKEEDLIFGRVTLGLVNRYLKRKAKALFREQKSKSGELYSKITIQDFRHISACYWLPRYPTQQGMMYRFGWKNADKIFYYSEFLGMNDNIKQENMLIDVTKTDLQNEIETQKTKLAQQGDTMNLILAELEKLRKKVRVVN